LRNCPVEAGAGVLFLLAKEPDKPPAISPTHHVSDAKSVICGASDADPRPSILTQLKVSWQEIAEVADSTKGQRTNPE